MRKDEAVVIGGRTLLGKKLARPETAPRFYYQFTEINLNGKGDRFFVFFRWLLFPFLLIRMQHVFKKEKCNYVLAIFPDEYYCMAGYLIARWNKAGFSTYFHNTYLENRKGIFGRRLANWLQPRMFEYSDYIFVMSEGMQRYYEAHYPQRKFVPLLHTFTEYVPVKKAGFKQKEKWDLVMIGTFNASNADATGRFVKAIKKDPRFRLSMYTHVPKFLLQQRGIDTEALDYKGFLDDRGLINDESLIEAFQDFDICVLTHGFTGGYSPIEYETIFPTRSIPYLLSGRPILLHSPRNSYLTEFMEKHNCAEVVAEADEKKIIQGLENIIGNEKRFFELIDNAQKTSALYYGPRIVAS